MIEDVLANRISWSVEQGDCLDLMRAMPANSVHCVVTSPPYWGLRDYGNPPRVWGGDAGHDTHEWEHIRAPWANSMPGPNGVALNTAFRESHVHEWGDALPPHHPGQVAQTNLNGRGTAEASAKGQNKHAGQFCACGAWLGCLGLEPTIEMFVAHIVEIFREVRRILRPDGTLWLNMGDSYSGGGYSNHKNTGGAQRADGGKQHHTATQLGPKQLIGMPWRVAFALQADGWILRSEVIWSKPNPMPESVLDRPTKAHEQIFLFAKSERYFYDADAIREEAGENTHSRGSGLYRKLLESEGQPGSELVKSSKRSFAGATREVLTSRNKRDVWTVGTQPFSDAHFATFPPDLIEPCILAGTSAKGVCPDCGAPWQRVTETETNWHGRKMAGASVGYNAQTNYQNGVHGAGMSHTLGTVKRETLGWAPTCAHTDLDPVPAIVLDPFSGASTTGLVALRHGRRFIGLELNPDYCAMSRKRIEGDQPLINTVAQTAPPDVQSTIFDLIERIA